jgi:hypothetical protein
MRPPTPAVAAGTSRATGAPFGCLLKRAPGGPHQDAIEAGTIVNGLSFARVR